MPVVTVTQIASTVYTTATSTIYSTVAATPAVPIYGPNIVVNPSFETNGGSQTPFPPWTVSSSGTAVNAYVVNYQTAAHSGKSYM